MIYSKLFRNLPNKILPETVENKNSIFNILRSTSKKLVNEIFSQNMLRIGPPSIRFRQEFSFCKKIDTKCSSFLGRLFFYSFKPVLLQQECDCKLSKYDPPQNYLTSFLTFLDQPGEDSNFSKILILLISQNFSSQEIKNLFQLLHNICPPSYNHHFF